MCPVPFNQCNLVIHLLYGNSNNVCIIHTYIRTYVYVLYKVSLLSQNWYMNKTPLGKKRAKALKGDDEGDGKKDKKKGKKKK